MATMTTPSLITRTLTERLAELHAELGPEVRLEVLELRAPMIIIERRLVRVTARVLITIDRPTHLALSLPATASGSEVDLDQPWSAPSALADLMLRLLAQGRELVADPVPLEVWAALGRPLESAFMIDLRVEQALPDSTIPLVRHPLEIELRTDPVPDRALAPHHA